LHELRTSEQLSLRALGEETNLSATMLSQIERGVVEPSLKTLRSLAGYFGTSVSALFDEGAVVEAYVSRPGTRPRISSPRGSIQYERLTKGNGKLEVLRGVLAPGDSSSDAGWSHDAVECAYVLAGSLTVEIGDTTYDVGAGSAVTLNSNKPHRYINNGSEVVEFLLSVTPPTP
jgi:transcriptional regulator with XRE-family HTH domain